MVTAVGTRFLLRRILCATLATLYLLSSAVISAEAQQEYQASGNDLPQVRTVRKLHGPGSGGRAFSNGRRTLLNEDDDEPGMAGDDSIDGAGTDADYGHGALLTSQEATATGGEAPHQQQQRCVVVMGTGRSGSTSLVDALNQLPRYFIRGEQDGAFWYLYLAWRMLESAWAHAHEYRSRTAHLAAERGPAAAAHLSFASVKDIYDAFASQQKMPWFNDLHPDRLREAVRAFYAATYGYHGPGYVSGFKDIRFVRGRAFASPDSTYEDFQRFLAFLRTLCDDVKVLLNSRASAEASDNKKLTHMLRRDGVLDAEELEPFEEDLKVTHDWYDRYAAEHPDHAFRVLMEHMFDTEENATLARRLLGFLGEDPTTPISFARMPSWSTNKRPASHSRPRPPLPELTPWHLRRRRLAGWLRGLADWVQEGGVG